MRLANMDAWSRLLGQATYALAALAGVFLLFLVGLLTSAVVMRYVVGQPILGVNEIVQQVAVALAMLALPYTTHTGSHVRADIFDRFLGRWGRFGADLLTRALSIWALWLLVGRTWAKLLDAYEFEDVTNMLNLPVWPVYAMVAGAMVLTILVMAVQVIAIAFSGKAAHD